jgi:hypothetical protein
MTECWAGSNTYEMLHAELETSRNTSWGLGPINSDDGYFSVTRSGAIALRPKAQYIRQYFKYGSARRHTHQGRRKRLVVEPVAFVSGWRLHGRSQGAGELVAASVGGADRHLLSVLFWWAQWLTVSDSVPRRSENRGGQSLAASVLAQA